MFREMRRSRQKLDGISCKEILKNATSGVLALYGDEGYPYAVPMSFCADGEYLYFHSAKSGHKIDAVRRDERASFCVVSKDGVVPEEYTTYFESVIVFGRISVITDEKEKRRAITLLADKYNPDDTPEHREHAINAEYAPLCMLKMKIEHVSGKQAIELVKQKSGH